MQTNGSFGTLPEFRAPDVSVAADADGDVVVAWSGLLDTGAGNVFELQFSRLSRTGELSESVIVDTAPSPGPESGVSIDSPVVSMDDAGGFFLGWIDRAAFEDNTIRMQTFNADGTERAAEFEVVHLASTGASVSQIEVAARPDGDGAAYAYFRNTSDSTFQHVQVGRVSESATIGDEVIVPGTASENPSIAMFADGSFIVGFDRHPDLTDHPVSFTRAMVQRFDTDGAAAGSPIDLGTPAGGATGTHHAWVDSMADGGFVAASLSSRSTTPRSAPAR